VLPALVSAAANRQRESSALIKEPAGRPCSVSGALGTPLKTESAGRSATSSRAESKCAYAGSRAAGQRCFNRSGNETTTPTGPVLFVASAAWRPEPCGGCGAGSTNRLGTMEGIPAAMKCLRSDTESGRTEFRTRVKPDRLR